MSEEEHHGDPHHHVTKINNNFHNSLAKLFNIIDGPVTFFRENVIEKFQKQYPYYHRQYQRVPTVDECAYGDHVCVYEANEQFLRDRKVDKFITQILSQRVKECYFKEGPYDGYEKCRKLDDDYEQALTNYFIKYGELSAKATAIDAYMKQKHRLIWQRRNPEKDIVGLDKQNEIKKEIEQYQRRVKDNPIQG